MTAELSPCPLCDGTGWRPIDDPSTGVRRVARCDCWREQIVHRRLADAGIEPRYRKCTLESFRIDSDSHRDAVQRCQMFIDRFPVVDKGLLFMGYPGSGKTHLATAVLKEVIQRTGAAGMFVDVRVLLRSIRDTYNPVVKATELQVIRPVMESPLLVLDDLGAEKMTEWVDETMTLIVTARYNKKLPTIFTTNYLDREADDKSLAEVLFERVGARIHSRLHEMCDFIELQILDYRKIGDEATPEQMHRLEKHAQSMSKNGMPSRPKSAKAQLKRQGGAIDLRWPGGRAGS
jgi:DNA replication protein DnaC